MSRSRWTHAICEACWVTLDSRDPVRVIDVDREPCCWCGMVTGAGIYRRDDPGTLRCGGEHP